MWAKTICLHETCTAYALVEFPTNTSSYRILIEQKTFTLCVCLHIYIVIIRKSYELDINTFVIGFVIVYHV